jgi:hypothetical protein
MAVTEKRRQLATIMVRKGGNLKNGGYDKKAPTGSNYEIQCKSTNKAPLH